LWRIYIQVESLKGSIEVFLFVCLFVFFYVPTAIKINQLN